MWTGRFRLWGATLCLLLVVAACTTGGATPSTSQWDQGASSTTTADGTPPDSVARPQECAELEPGQPWTTGLTATATTVQEGGDDVPRVDLVMYPHPDYEGKPWSHWGQGIVASNGRHYSAIGDHLGADGNSFVYEYDPETMTLTMILDVLDTVGHEQGAWGYGKVHAQMAEDRCGNVLVSTYWGKRNGLTFGNGYEGDVLLRLDPERRATDVVGVILPEHGVASMATTPDGALLYAEAADPFGQKTGSFVVLDATTGEVVFEDDDDAHGGYRSIAVMENGVAYITWEEGGLARYDPVANELDVVDTRTPGEMLRAATEPDSEGNVYAVSRDPAVFFRMSPDGGITELGTALGYTASLALSPDGSRFYYVPEAHGRAWESGAPLIAVDTESGETEVIVELHPLILEEFGLRAGGTYSVVAADDGKTVYVAFNVGDPATDDSFGEIVLAVVTLP